MKKKGELTTQQIVGLIILITSFVIILALLFRLNLGEETDKELCRNSVLLKGKSLLREATPLNCYRSYKCITADGSCEGLNNPEVVEVDNVNEIYRELANEMSECWWQFGEGKVNYVGDDLTKNNQCSICSQILFDDSLKTILSVSDEGSEEVQEVDKISKDGLYDYLSKNIRPGGDITYLEYLLNTRDIEGIKREFFEKEGVDSFGNIDIGKQFFVVTGITKGVSDVKWIVASAIGGTLAALFVTSNPIGWVTGAVLFGVAGASAAEIGESEYLEPHIGAIIIDGIGVKNKFMSPTIVEVNSRKFEALNCEQILTYT